MPLRLVNDVTVRLNSAPVSLNSTMVYSLNIIDLKIGQLSIWVDHFHFVFSFIVELLIHELLIFFQPVPWQGGFKNPYSGIIVWPEPDPVKTKLTLFKVNRNLS